MAIAITNLREGKKTGGWDESLKIHFAEIALDTAYAAGGYAITAANFNMSSILGVVVLGYNGIASSIGALPVWDRAASKLIIYKGAGSTTVTTGSGGFTEMSTNDSYITASVKVQVLVIGLA